MAHESFEDETVAELLNKYFVAIKVDKEERPDIDSIYMRVCQAFTGSGGWPTSIFMTPDQKPFFAGTYFPKKSSRGMIGFIDLLQNIHEKWVQNKSELLDSGNEVIKILQNESDFEVEEEASKEDLISNSVDYFKKVFDKENGGFRKAPKFPSPHNLMFLMDYFETTKDKEALYMAEKTLQQMYKGGIFDHIGFGFSRYSTDNYFLVPHFEKMLYDNALLIISYMQAFSITKNDFYAKVAIKTAKYILREMTDLKGGFYCAQDADSEGVEGKYYLFAYDEIINILGEDPGRKFTDYFNITKEGNFEGKNIPNLLNNSEFDDTLEYHFQELYDYRITRSHLHLDDKVLTSWNALMISALAILYRILGDDLYLEQAKEACQFIDNNLWEDNTLYVSYRKGRSSSKGFLDDYALYIFALINMYEACYKNDYLERAVLLCDKALSEFYDEDNSGFYLYGKDHEKLVLRPKETYDGAIPSGNSVMTYNLIKLGRLLKNKKYMEIASSQIDFLAKYASSYPTGYSFYLITLSMYLNPSKDIVCVIKDKEDKGKIKVKFSFNTNLRIVENPTEEYPLINDNTTIYICENYNCLPPTNDLKKLME